MKQIEILQEQTKSNESELTKLVEREKVEGTPFEIIKYPDSGYFVALNKYRVTEEFETMLEAVEVIDNKEWDFLTTVMITIAKLEQEYKTN